MTRPDRVPFEPTPPTLLALPCQGSASVCCPERTDGWTPLRVTVALPPDIERTSSPTTHHRQLEVLAAMVREALAYDRQHSMGGRG